MELARTSSRDMPRRTGHRSPVEANSDALLKRQARHARRRANETAGQLRRREGRQAHAGQRQPVPAGSQASVRGGPPKCAQTPRLHPRMHCASLPQLTEQPKGDAHITTQTLPAAQVGAQRHRTRERATLVRRARAAFLVAAAPLDVGATRLDRYDGRRVGGRVSTIRIARAQVGGGVRRVDQHVGRVAANRRRIGDGCIDGPVACVAGPVVQLRLPIRAALVVRPGVAGLAASADPSLGEAFDPPHPTAPAARAMPTIANGTTNPRPRPFFDTMSPAHQADRLRRESRPGSLVRWAMRPPSMRALACVGALCCMTGAGCGSGATAGRDTPTVAPSPTAASSGRGAAPCYAGRLGRGSTSRARAATTAVVPASPSTPRRPAPAEASFRLLHGRRRLLGRLDLLVLNTAVHGPFGQAQWEASGAPSVGHALDRARATNPFRAASYVFIPYCTGDLHAGSNVATYDVLGPRKFAHVGRRNVEALLPACARPRRRPRAW